MAGLLRLAAIVGPDAAEVHPISDIPVTEEWRVVTVGPVEWPAGATALLLAGQPGRPVAVDRIRLEWR
jgi:hypothetical protein